MEHECRPGIRAEFIALSAIRVGVKDKSPFIGAFEQDHSGGRLALCIRSRQGHCLGQNRLFPGRPGEPFLKPRDRIGKYSITHRAYFNIL
jgi:hypothetical protein